MTGDDVIKKGLADIKKELHLHGRIIEYVGGLPRGVKVDQKLAKTCDCTGSKECAKSAGRIISRYENLRQLMIELEAFTK